MLEDTTIYCTTFKYCYIDEIAWIKILRNIIDLWVITSIVGQCKNVTGQVINIISEDSASCKEIHIWRLSASLVAWENPKGRCGVGGMLGRPPGPGSGDTAPLSRVTGQITELLAHGCRLRTHEITEEPEVLFCQVTPNGVRTPSPCVLDSLHSFRFHPQLLYSKSRLWFVGFDFFR